MAGQKSISEWEKLFKAADKDNSGCLSEAELKELLKKGNSNLTDTEFNNVFQHFDEPGGDKKITIKEFIDGLNKIVEFIQDMKDEFQKCDTDKSGYLDKAELTKILKESGQNFSDADINEIVKQADKSGDGKICFEEFINAFT